MSINTVAQISTTVDISSKGPHFILLSFCWSIFLLAYQIKKRYKQRFIIRKKAGSIFVLSYFWFGVKKVQISIQSIKSLPRPNLGCATLQRRNDIVTILVILSMFLEPASYFHCITRIVYALIEFSVSLMRIWWVTP